MSLETRCVRGGRLLVSQNVLRNFLKTILLQTKGRFFTLLYQTEFIASSSTLHFSWAPTESQDGCQR